MQSKHKMHSFGTASMRNRWRQHRLQASILFLDEETKRREEAYQKRYSDGYQANVQTDGVVSYVGRSQMTTYYEHSNNY